MNEFIQDVKTKEFWASHIGWVETNDQTWWVFQISVFIVLLFLLVFVCCMGHSIVKIFGCSLRKSHAKRNVEVEGDDMV